MHAFPLIWRIYEYNFPVDEKWLHYSIFVWVYFSRCSSFFALKIFIFYHVEYLSQLALDICLGQPLVVSFGFSCGLHAEVMFQLTSYLFRFYCRITILSLCVSRSTAAHHWLVENIVTKSSKFSSRALSANSSSTRYDTHCVTTTHVAPRRVHGQEMNATWRHDHTRR